MNEEKKAPIDPNIKMGFVKSALRIFEGDPNEKRPIGFDIPGTNLSSHKEDGKHKTESSGGPPSFPRGFVSPQAGGSPPNFGGSEHPSPGLGGPSSPPPGKGSPGGPGGLPAGFGSPGGIPAGFGGPGSPPAGVGSSGGLPAGFGGPGSPPAGVGSPGGPGGPPAGFGGHGGPPEGLGGFGSPPAGFGGPGGPPAGFSSPRGPPVGCKGSGGPPEGFGGPGGPPGGVGGPGGPMHECEDVPEHPDQLSQELFQNILKDFKKTDNVNIKDLLVAPISSIGDNYSSLIYTIKINTDEEHGSHQYEMFAKLMPQNPFRKQMTNVSKTFVKEISVYNTMFPIFEEIVQEHGIVKDFIPVTKMYHGFTDGDKDLIILENLKPLGYEMLQRSKGADLEHSKIVMDGLARYHALSYVMKTNYPEKFKPVREMSKETQFIPETRQMFEGMSKMTSQLTSSMLRESTTHSQYANCFANLMDNMYESMVKLLTPSESWSVVTHGDVWINNMLFRYDENKKVTDIKLIDFQMVRYGSLALDILHFIFTSTLPEIRRQHLNDLLMTYHDKFCDALRQLGADPSPFTFEVFKKEWDDHLLFGFYIGIMMLAVVTANKEDIPDLDSMTEDIFTSTDASPFQKMMQGKFFGTRLFQLIDDFVEFGYITAS